MKNLILASDQELRQLLTLAIGRAFRLASEGDETGAILAKNRAKTIGEELKKR